MKRITLLSIILLFFISSSVVHALTWASPFVVWEGKVYNVAHFMNENRYEPKPELILDEDKIGKIIGEVKTRANDQTGVYHGDASNHYRIGTKYYEIIGTPTSSAIAIKEGDKWVKAVYAFKAQKNFNRPPLTIRELFKNIYFNSAVVIIVFIIVGFILRTKKSKIAKNIK